ncbi:hypothetical protein NDU88_007028 [Pleurodeles waltl]|uniref:Uncharacterized protein n=1 Tax=Pleurodeles waltl TaxID=8319 RepID=A0AAV7MEJ6_PLEWA|nr:hypothetical protein NDU88_007028 [Pleurodeles waltl]
MENDCEMTSGRGAEDGEMTSGQGAEDGEMTSGQGAEDGEMTSGQGAEDGEMTSGRGAEDGEMTSGQGAEDGEMTCKVQECTHYLIEMPLAGLEHGGVHAEVHVHRWAFLLHPRVEQNLLPHKAPACPPPGSTAIRG